VDTSRSTQRAQLQAQEKQFRATMAQLFAKVRDLKLQVDALHSSDVFSIAIFKQTQEIEKLAKQLKNYAKA
jgi:cell division protein FtsB